MLCKPIAVALDSKEWIDQTHTNEVGEEEIDPKVSREKLWVSIIGRRRRDLSGSFLPSL
jgi:hypothetical protein